jgi:Rad3-related DNA helicase
VDDWIQFFPLPEPRPSQVEAINFSLEELTRSNKKVVVLELGCGVGKSAIGLTIARYINSVVPLGPDFKKGSYFLTTQKVLQEQYVNDFKETMKSIKSSSNYPCSFYPKQSCEESHKVLKAEPKESSFYRACSGNCVYRREKENFLTSMESVTNFPYFITESSYSKSIVPRQVLVVDEAHNAASELSKFIEVTLSEYVCTKTLKIDFIPENSSQSSIVKWVNDVYFPRLVEHTNYVRGLAEKSKDLKEKIVEFLGFNKQLEILEGHVSKIRTFMSVYDPNNWVMNEVFTEGKSFRKIEFKVIDVSPFSERYLFKFGEKVVMMSATILTKESFCELLGLSSEEVGFISIPTPFPPENRPILYAPVGRMNKDNIENTLPKLAQAVKAILDSHPNEKGIIHCSTYKIANYIKKNVKSRRLLVHDATNREEILKQHVEGDKATVLLSPSMTEGVDLKDDASRFQILCKIPYPYLGDKLTTKKMHKWKWWYPTMTAKTIVQACGRSVRTMEDHAVTYILDEDWETFYRRNSSLFSEEFRIALKE